MTFDLFTTAPRGDIRGLQVFEVGKRSVSVVMLLELNSGFKGPSSFFKVAMFHEELLDKFLICNHNVTLFKVSFRDASMYHR